MRLELTDVVNCLFLGWKFTGRRCQNVSLPHLPIKADVHFLLGIRHPDYGFTEHAQKPSLRGM